MDPQGFGAIFAQSIPSLVSSDLRPAADAFLALHGLDLGGIDAYSLHPGGAKVIQALETAFGLSEGSLADERAVLADYGNMSAATIMFVLDRALGRGFRGRRLVSALGPGFTASFLTMLH
jgi:alkylresorcinol/alkylpyrone synthase